MEHANTLIKKQSGEIAVLAHSQGAAISAVALFHEINLSTLPVRRLSTVGAAITLLGKSAWHLAPEKDAYKPIANWVNNAPNVRWDNYWAIWDPFSAGPIGDSFGAQLDRWRSCYRSAASSGVDGSENVGEEKYFPAEHAVHNTSMPFTDHQSYARNIVQVVEPIAMELLGPQFAPIPAQVRAVRNGRVVRIRRARGALLVAAVIIAVLLPTQSWFLRSVGRAIDWAVSVLDGGLHLLGVERNLTVDVIYVGGTASRGTADFTLLGTVLLVALVGAALIWSIGLFTVRVERRLVWDCDFGSPPRGVFLRELVGQAIVFLFASALILAVVFETPVSPLASIIAIGVTLLALLVVHTGQIPEVAPEHAPPIPVPSASAGVVQSFDDPFDDLLYDESVDAG